MKQKVSENASKLPIKRDDPQKKTRRAQISATGGGRR
jgi:hypothetical protein